MSDGLQKNVDYGELLKDSFSTLVKQENLVPLLVAPFLVFLGLLCLVLPGLALAEGYASMCLRVARGETVQIGDVWPGTEKAIAGVVAGILMGIAIAIGFFLLVVPGLAAIFFFSLTLTLLADTDLSPVEAMKESFNRVKANPVPMLVVLVIGMALSSALSVVPFIGSLIGGAFSSLLIALTYTRLFSDSSGSGAPVAQLPDS